MLCRPLATTGLAPCYSAATCACWCRDGSGALYIGLRCIGTRRRRQRRRHLIRPTWTWSPTSRAVEHHAPNSPRDLPFGFRQRIEDGEVAAAYRLDERRGRTARVPGGGEVAAPKLETLGLVAA